MQQLRQLCCALDEVFCRSQTNDEIKRKYVVQVRLGFRVSFVDEIGLRIYNHVKAIQERKKSIAAS